VIGGVRLNDGRSYSRILKVPGAFTLYQS
jgi:hypothetical protein